MLWKLFDAPFPEARSMVPGPVQERAAVRIRQYWQGRAWQLVLGEGVLWLLAFDKDSTHTPLYLGLALMMGVVYLLGFLSNTFVWLTGTLILLSIQGMAISGLGAVTALSYMLPYTFASMMLDGRRRLIMQTMCVGFFWMSLIYEILPVFPQLEPIPFILVSYNILIAAFTFQTLRFLNQLAVKLTEDYVAEEIQMRSQQFLARVSHDLRTPLNSMLGFSKLLRRAELSERHRHYLEQTIDEGEHLNRLVSDLLDSAHLNTGKLSLNRTPTNINALCEKIVEEHRQSVKPGVELRTALSPDAPLLNIDPMRMRQAVSNLVTNAAKHTDAGTITLRTRCHDASLLVDVEDTGVGISEEQQQLIFVPFVQLDSRRAGVGLGLDIASQLVRLHGGTIHLRSAVGQGSTFTIELPLAAVTAS